MMTTSSASPKNDAVQELSWAHFRSRMPVCSALGLFRPCLRCPSNGCCARGPRPLE